MRKKAAIAFLVATGLVMGGAVPAAALSCAEPGPFDMKAAIANADAAAIGTVTSIASLSDDEYGDAEAVLTVELSEVFKGTMPRRLTLQRQVTVWGPFYEEGDELALLVNDGVVRDGFDSLCGPFFSADDMRQAGPEPTIVAPEPQGWSMFGLLRGLFDLLSLLFGLR